jgi:hypothetical protein
MDGYFEETKMARVRVGDRVEAKLMGYAQPILGHVATVTRGIGVSDAAVGTQGSMSTLTTRGSPWLSACRFASRLTVYHQAFRSSPA